MLATLLAYAYSPKASYRNCQICMMTFDYFQTISKRNEMKTSQVVDEMEDICDIFSPVYQRECKSIIAYELENAHSFNSFENTTQQFCYSLGFCKRPGPEKQVRDTTVGDAFKTFFKPAKKFMRQVMDAIDTL